MGTVRPVSSSALRKRPMWSSLPNGTTSSSWKVMPYAPSSASLCTASTGSSGVRVASPKGSRACQPTVHRPNENRSSRVGCGVTVISIEKFVYWLNYLMNVWHCQGCDGMERRFRRCPGTPGERARPQPVPRSAPRRRQPPAAVPRRRRCPNRAHPGHRLSAGRRSAGRSSAQRGRAGPPHRRRPARSRPGARRRRPGRPGFGDQRRLSGRLRGRSGRRRTPPGRAPRRPARSRSAAGPQRRRAAGGLGAGGRRTRPPYAGRRRPSGARPGGRRRARAGRPNLGWRDVDAAAALSRSPAVADLPLTVDNEANLAALGELHASPPGSGNFLYVSGEIGIGAGIVLDGALYRGARGWSGELGHVAVRPDGPRCRCGAQGCLEQYAGQETILRAARLVDGTVQSLAERAATGDSAALAALASAADALGVAVAGVVNLLDVDTVLLGGVYAPLAPWLVPGITAEIDRRVLTAAWSPVTVCAATLAGDAAVVGAAVVVRPVRDNPERWLATSRLSSPAGPFRLR